MEMIMFRNEWIKQAKRKKMWVFAGIVALVPLVLAVLQRLLLPGQTVLAREDVLSSALHLVAPLVLPLMAAALAIDAFPDEISKGAIRSTLFLPAGRTAVYWAKALAVLAGCGVLVKGIGPVLPTTWMGFGASVGTMSLVGGLSALAVLAAWTVLFAMTGWLRFEKRPL